MGYTRGHKWTEKNKEWLRANVGGISYAVLAERFNRRFKADMSPDAISGALCRFKIRSKFKSGFKPGHTPINKGEKGYYWAGCERSWFKKGHKAHNAAPVGAVLKTSGGYLRIKVGEPSVWKFLHVVVYESLNGPVPDGHIVIFGDKDKMNLSPSNLLCVSRGQLGVMNHHKFIYSDAGLTKAGALMASVKIAAWQRKLNLNLNKKKERKKNGAKRV